MALRRSLWELKKIYCVLLFDMNATQLMTTHLLLHDDHSVVLMQVTSYEITCCLVKEGESILLVPASVNHAPVCGTQESVPHRTLLLCQSSPCLYVIYLSGFHCFLRLLSSTAK